MFAYKDKHCRREQTHKMVSVVDSSSIILPSSWAHWGFVEIGTRYKKTHEELMYTLIMYIKMKIHSGIFIICDILNTLIQMQ
jgi:hypothetical protein